MAESETWSIPPGNEEPKAGSRVYGAKLDAETSALFRELQHAFKKEDGAPASVSETVKECVRRTHAAEVRKRAEKIRKSWRVKEQAKATKAKKVKGK